MILQRLIRKMMMAALFAGLAVSAVEAQEAAPDAAPDVGALVEAAAAPFQALELSARLARMGEMRADPWLLATAARIRLSTPPVVRSGASGAVRDVADKAASQQGDVETDAAPASIDWPGVTRRWLDEAEALADGNPEVLAYVASVRALDFKGRNGGPQVSLSRLAGGQAHVFRERFAPGRPAVVYVEGDGDAPLAVSVKAVQETVCQNAGPGDVKLCTWTARAPGDYVVEVRNLGSATNRYAYGTN